MSGTELAIDTDIRKELQTGKCLVPSKVRLITDWRDPYRWEYPQELSDLFNKQLSKHSITSLKYLCDYVGRTFQAVPTHSMIDARSVIVEPTSLSQSTRELLLGSAECKSNEPTADNRAAASGCTSGELGDGPGRLSYLRYQLASLKSQCQTLSQHLGATLQITHQQEAHLARCVGLVNQVTPTIVDFQRNIAGSWMYQGST